jgi:hypothetical protein
MLNEMQARALTTYQVAPDGYAVRLCFEDAKGQPGALTLPTSCIHQLIMTLPNLLSKAIRAQHGDETLRAVFPLGHWNLEAEAGTSNLILTMTTSDGFEVAFTLEPKALWKLIGEIEAARLLAETKRPLSS